MKEGMVKGIIGVFDWAGAEELEMGRRGNATAFPLSPLGSSSSC